MLGLLLVIAGDSKLLI